MLRERADVRPALSYVVRIALGQKRFLDKPQFYLGHHLGFSFLLLFLFLHLFVLMFRLL